MKLPNEIFFITEKIWKAYAKPQVNEYILEAKKLTKNKVKVLEGEPRGKGKQIVIFPKGKHKGFETITLLSIPIIEHNIPGLKQKHNIYYILCIFIFFFTLFSPYILQHDDLFRSLRSGDYGFDYTSFYRLNWYFSFQTYPIWDPFYYFTWKTLGIWSVKLWEALSIGAFLLAFSVSTKNVKEEWRLIGLTFSLLILRERLFLGKPSTFLAFLIPLALQLKGLLAFLLGLFMGTSYYLFPLFMIPLLDRKEYQLAFVLSIAFWTAISEGRYFEEVVHFLQLVFQSRGNIFIAENLSPILKVVEGNLPLALFYIFSVYSIIHSFPHPNALRLLYFLGLNQIRMLDAAVPIAATFLKDMKKEEWEKILLLSSLIMGGFAVMATLNLFGESGLPVSEEELSKFNLSNSVILCDLNPASYLTVLMSNNISIGVPFEVGLSTKEDTYALNILENEEKPKEGCSFLKRYDYILDLNTIKNTWVINNCLKVKNISKKGYYRVIIWGVKNKTN